MMCHFMAFDPATITICRYNFPGDVTMLLYGLPTAKGWSRVIMGFASPAVGGGWVATGSFAINSHQTFPGDPIKQGTQSSN